MTFPKRMPLLVACAFILGVTVGVMWASAQEVAASEQKEKVLITGLDGGQYEDYKAALVTRVQEALKKEGFYTGEVNSELDEATMNALAEYQKKNGLLPSGVPTPQTRKQLLNE